MFIRCPHPKVTLKNDPTKIKKMLEDGWLCQPKINGRRIQIHRRGDVLTCYTRQGSIHTKELSEGLKNDILGLLDDGDVIEGEFIFQTQKVYLFDYIVRRGESLAGLAWIERFSNFDNRRFEHIEKLPTYTLENFSYILALMADVDTDFIEGVVFKSKHKDFTDDSIVRCRKK